MKRHGVCCVVILGLVALMRVHSHGEQMREGNRIVNVYSRKELRPSNKIGAVAESLKHGIESRLRVRRGSGYGNRY